jgi:uncharacterized membrane protein
MSVKPTESAPTSETILVEQQSPELAKTLQKLTPQDRKLVLQFVEQTSFTGPLPPPEMLARYDTLIPNGADRLMRLVESQVSHRHSMESQVVRAQTSLPRLGQMIAAVLAAGFGIIGSILALQGHDWVAGTVFGTTIVGLVTVFVVGRRGRGSSSDTAVVRPKSKRTK